MEMEHLLSGMLSIRIDQIHVLDSKFLFIKRANPLRKGGYPSQDIFGNLENIRVMLSRNDEQVSGGSRIVIEEGANVDIFVYDPSRSRMGRYGTKNAIHSKMEAKYAVLRLSESPIESNIRRPWHPFGIIG